MYEAAANAGFYVFFTAFTIYTDARRNHSANLDKCDETGFFWVDLFRLFPINFSSSYVYLHDYATLHNADRHISFALVIVVHLMNRQHVVLHGYHEPTTRTRR